MSGGEERAGLDLVKEYREADPADWWAGSWELESHYRSKAIMRMEADCFFFSLFLSFPFFFLSYFYLCFAFRVQVVRVRCETK